MCKKAIRCNIIRSDAEFVKASLNGNARGESGKSFSYGDPDFADWKLMAGGQFGADARYDEP
jgi:hypothetical protein